MQMNTAEITERRKVQTEEEEKSKNLPQQVFFLQYFRLFFTYPPLVAGR